MTERKIQRHDSDSDSSTDPNTLAPEGHKLRKSTTALRFASSKLALVNNPVQEVHEGEEQRLIPNPHAKAPTPEPAGAQKTLRFTKRESASTSELFYDLWFVANLNVFATVHPVTELRTLVPFIGYFLLLWITWLITTVYDARFGQDGIFERIARASHLTVMIGFAVVGVTFDKEDLVRPIFKATSLFLMMSRLVLALQYGLVLFHARHHRRSRNALMFAVGLHLMPAIGYLIIAFVAEEHQDHHLIVAWYVIGLIEMAAIIVHATFSKTLSFEGTHFNERLNLLTLIILGEGVIILAKNITKIVEYTYVKEISRHWSSPLVGILIAAGGILYIIFQLYFDWMHHHSHMKTTHQAYWTMIHLPFHIALVLLAEGGSQWAVWWRAMEAFSDAGDKIQDTVFKAADSLSTAKVVEELMDTVKEILKKYGSDVDEGGQDANRLSAAATNLLQLPDSFWDKTWDDADPQFISWSKNYLSVTTTVMNAIADAFDISVEQDKSATKGTDPEFPELEALAMTMKRLRLIFVYVFISAGLVLILLMLMAIVSKRKGWSVFNMVRTGFVFCIGAGLCFVALISLNTEQTKSFLETPWPLPTIMICFFIVLIVTHLPHPPKITFKRTEPVDVELAKVPTEPESSNHSIRESRHTIHAQDNHHQEHQDQQQPQFNQGYDDRRARQTLGGIEGLHAQLPGHYDVGRRPSQAAAVAAAAAAGTVKRGMTLRRGLTTIQRAAKSIHFEAGGYDPIAEGDLFFQGGNSSPITGRNLYSV